MFTLYSLQASVNALRDELAVTREAAQARESTLIDAINELRLTVFTRATPPLSEPVEHETEPVSAGPAPIPISSRAIQSPSMLVLSP